MLPPVICRFGRFAVGLLSIFFLLSGVTSAQAQQTDVSGDWLVYVYEDDFLQYVQNWSTQQAGVNVTGSGFGGIYTWQITGAVAGTQCSGDVDYDQVPYVGNFTGAVTGNSVVGTWVDNVSHDGTWFGQRVASDLPSTSTVLCTRGPGVNDDFVCTVTVAGNSVAPTGNVDFVTQSGSFKTGSKCTLSPINGFSSTCGVVYMQPVGGIPSGTPVPVTALYGGDTFYEPSSSPAATTTIAVLPAAPVVCFADSQDPACGGLKIEALEPTITGNTLGALTFSYFAPTGDAAGQELLPAARVSKPRGAGEIGLEFRYVARLRDNPTLANSQALKKFSSQLRKGAIIASVKTKLGFGQAKDIVVVLNSKGRRLVNAIRNAGISEINLNAVVGVRRKVDRRGSSFSTNTSADIR